MKKGLTITLLVLLTVGLFVSCNADAIEELFGGNGPKYTVSFDMQGHGTQIQQITGVTSGSTISAPNPPTAEGFVFRGWFKEASCEDQWSFTKDPVTADTTLYAKWVETVGYVIGNNFPKNDSAWTDGSGSTCYYDPTSFAFTPCLVFSKTEPYGFVTVFLANVVAKTTDGYTYYDSNSKFTITFYMNEGELVSIEFNADDEATDQIKAVKGTYTQPGK